MANAQIYAWPLEIIPQNPSTVDSIYVVIKASTPNQGNYYGYTLDDYGDSVYINGCYSYGAAASPETYYDTINLGLKPFGTLYISFNCVFYISGVCQTTAIDSTDTLINIGTMGLNNIKYTPKELVKVVDLMGRNSQDKPNTTLIYIYSDGTTEKVFRME
jgi:hypothetical protein